jgi:hypothetical protein
MQSDFSAETRLLACEACGAPLRVARDGGEAPCPCGAVLVVAARILTMPPPSPLTEAERWHRLRSQERLPERMSTSFARVTADGLDDALARWPAVRAKCASGDSRAAEDLLSLTLAIQYHDRVSSDTRRIRAMYESALEAVRSPSHRAVFLGLLASSACRLGDASGAEGWLRAMDPHAPDLRADSAYRNAHAAYFMVRGEYRIVLEMLGDRFGAVPYHAQYRLFAAVVRASAHAKLGDVERAREQIAVLPKPGLARSVADKWPRLDLFTG